MHSVLVVRGDHRPIHCTLSPAPWLLRTGSFDGRVLVWDIGTGEVKHTYTGHQYQVTGVVVLPTGDIASGSVDRCVGVEGGEQEGGGCVAGS